MTSEIPKQNENDIWTDIPGFSSRANACALIPHERGYRYRPFLLARERVCLGA